MAERAAHRLEVRAPDVEYPILIEAGLLGRAVQESSALGLDGRVVIVTNTTLAPLYGERLASALPAALLVTMNDGEIYKTLETVASLYSAFVRAGLDRGGTVIALGGGVVGDTAGFAAATYMRGVRLVQVPTSLLAMVDSSAGGKVGVDLPEGKNLVGAFKQPALVLIDPETLSTLPLRELRCGLAEVIKHGLLADPGLIEQVAALNVSAWTEVPANLDLSDLVCRAVQVKVEVVQIDPYEQGVRAHLNLGHTFAHAIEQVSAYAWPHGEAVAVGLVAAARLSSALGLCDQALPEQVEAWVAGAGLPTRHSGLNAEALYAAMATDKKWRSGRSRFVLLEGIGRPVIKEGVPKDTVLAILEALS